MSIALRALASQHVCKVLYTNIAI